MSSEKITAKSVMLKGGLIYNPVLMQCAGLCPVVAAATNLKSAAMLAAALCVTTIVTCTAASAFMKNLKRWFRVPLYLIIGLIIICPVLWFAETRTLSNLSLSMKIYLPLMAVNSVTAVHCEQFSVKNSVKLAFYDALAVSVGSSAVLIICGILRELFGSSSFAGVHVNLPVTFRGALMPFGCLIILGFLAAGLKYFTAFFFPESVPGSERIVTRRKKNDGENDIEEVEIFDEFWTEPEPDRPALDLDAYDELFSSLENVFEQKEDDEQ